MVIYDFTWSVLNSTTVYLSPQEAIHVCNTLHRTLTCIIKSYTSLGLVYLSMVDLSDAYTLIWLRMEYMPSVAFLVPNKTPTDPQLVGFHLYLLMRYIDSAT